MDHETARPRLDDAAEHRRCAELLMEEFPLRAAEHLLACVAAATQAVTPPGRIPAAEALPEALFVRTSPVQVVNLTGWLQGAVSAGDRNPAGLRRFVAKAAEACGDYLADIEDYASSQAPAP